jgi:hypothetical protein
MRATFDRLRAQDRVDDADLERLWDEGEVLAATDLLGAWRGFGFSTGHRTGALLDRSRWHGKRFDAVDRVAPLVCRGDDGELFDDEKSAPGGASVWEVRFRGRVTATMVYDAMPVFDHFVRIDDNTLLGVMNGKDRLVRDDGRLFWFGLEREQR